MRTRPIFIYVFLVLLALFMVSRFGAIWQILHPVILPRDLQTELENADTFTLYSINPWINFHDKSTNVFEGHEIFGRIDIQSQGARVELIDALNDGISTAYRRRVGQMMCFNPRHGIRARIGDKTIELLICFECHQIYITSSAATNQVLTTTGDPAATFNKVLTDAGVPLAKY